jgi:Putative Flp pilus-assembly TadE/G-like
MGLLLVCVGLVVDVGHAMLVQRQLQAGVDAAALAGVQHLPDKLAAESVAMQYSATPGSKNAVNTVNNAATTAKAVCITGVPGCSRRDGGVNGVVVNSTSNVPTWFGKIIGISKLTVSAQATACSPCTVTPLDIMIVLDRTGSMCTPAGPGGSCPDLNNAISGIHTFLKLMDPTLDKVGLAVTPPMVNKSATQSCPNQPQSSVKYYGYDQWWEVNGNNKPPLPSPTESSFYVLASLEGADGNLADDYIIEDPVTRTWDLNPASTFVQRLGCVRTNGSTSYSLSIEEAKRELNTNGRGGVKDVIIFLSDGAANTSPQNAGTHWTMNGTGPNGWIWKPCGAGVQAAANVKGPQANPSTLVYTIGYDLNAGGPVPEKCRRPNSNGHQNGSNPLETGCGVVPSGWGGVTTGCSAWDAIRAMASKDAAGIPLFYEQPIPAKLDEIFRAIALDLSGSRGRLVDSTRPTLT